MKKIMFIIFLFVGATLINSQTSSQEYLSRIPALPSNACSLSDNQKTAFLDKVNNLDDELRDEIKKLESSTKAVYQNSADQVKQNIAKEYGISNDEMQKLSNNQMTEEEKRALADKVLKQKANMSMNDVESLKKMTPEERKAWAEAYGVKQMANAHTNPNANKVDINKAKRTNDLVQEQRSLMDKISKNDNDYLNKFTKLNEIDLTATKELDAKCESLRKELSTINDGEGSTEADTRHYKSVMSKIRNFQIDYCKKLTPLYYKILEDRLATIKTLFPDYKRLEEVNIELDKISAGINNDLSAQGLMQLQAIENYVSELKSAFKYAKYSTSE